MYISISIAAEANIFNLKYKLFKIICAFFFVSNFIHVNANAQAKEVLQFTTLTPTLYVVTSSEIIPAHKHHFTLSTISYLGMYQITESKWKSAAVTLALGLGKELIYDELFGLGDPNIQDMKWNALGVGQGMVFTFSLDF